MTSYGRRLQNIKSGISQQPPIGSQILNLGLDDKSIFYKYLKFWQPLMEDDHKLFKVEYLSNHLLDHTQI